MDSIVFRMTDASYGDILAALQNAPWDSTCECVIRQHEKPKRSEAQNRLAFRWYQERSKYTGHGIKYERATCKLMYGVPILRAREDDTTFRESYDNILKHLDYETKLKAMVDFDFPVTRLMSVKEMTHYLHTIDTETAEQGLALSHPDDIYLTAMGIKA